MSVEPVKSAFLQPMLSVCGVPVRAASCIRVHLSIGCRFSQDRVFSYFLLGGYLSSLFSFWYDIMTVKRGESTSLNRFVARASLVFLNSDALDGNGRKPAGSRKVAHQRQLDVPIPF